MSSTPLVSGIIIFQNAEQFIQEAIESVFTQTYDNWELLLIDGGSSDGSIHIAQRYAAQYPEKVRYLDRDRHQNRGMSAARNLGIGNAQGEYIAFLDAIDIWLPNKLEQQLAIMQAHPEAAMIYGSSTFWYSWTGKSEDIQRDTIPELGVQVNTLFEPPTLLNLLVQRKATAPCTCSILVRRDVAERLGGFEERFFGMFEEQAFCAKIFLEEPVFVADGNWDKYRQHPDSSDSTVQSTGQSDFARLFFLNWLEEYLFKQQAKDTEWKVLQRELLLYRHPQLQHLLEKFWYRQRKMKKLIKQMGQKKLPVQVLHWLRVQKTRR